MTNALSMFTSATVKLTAWYVAILVAISLLFSVVIFSIATSEVGSRISSIQQAVLPASNSLLYADIRDAQIHEAQSNLIASLILTNLCIWIAGGIGSYYLARRTLHPIEQAHEAQSRFTSDASHELRTPLASMKIELEVALRDPDLSPADMRELLESNLEEVNKLTDLSLTLLQLSRLDFDSIAKEAVDVHGSIKTVVQRLDIDPKRLDLQGTHPLYTFANPSSVEELITILIDNALKYSPDNSTIHMKTFRKKQMVGFTIINEGKGIEPDALPHIFDRFYQSDRSRTAHGNKGFGLGLSLAKNIVELYHGDLTVSSAPGKLTTFTVLLPAHAKGKGHKKPLIPS